MMRRLLGALTAGTIAVLCLVIWSELDAPAPDTETTEAGAIRPLQAAADRAPAESAERRTEWAQTILARPLFVPGRRPPSQAANAGTAPSRQTLPRMTAILIDGTTRKAIFAADGSERPVVVSEGSHIGAFTIQRIEAEQVTLLGPEGRRAIRTSFDPKPPAPVLPLQPAGLLTAPGMPGPIVLPGAQPLLLPVAR